MEEPVPQELEGNHQGEMPVTPPHHPLSTPRWLQQFATATGNHNRTTTAAANAVSEVVANGVLLNWEGIRGALISCGIAATDQACTLMVRMFDKSEQEALQPEEFRALVDYVSNLQYTFLATAATNTTTATQVTTTTPTTTTTIRTQQCAEALHDQQQLLQQYGGSAVFERLVEEVDVEGKGSIDWLQFLMLGILLGVVITIAEQHRHTQDIESRKFTVFDTLTLSPQQQQRRQQQQQQQQQQQEINFDTLLHNLIPESQRPT